MHSTTISGKLFLFFNCQVPDWIQQPVYTYYPWFKLTANNFFYVSIKISSYIVHAWVLHNSLPVDFVFKKETASATGHCFLFISILIMYAGNDDECYVSRIRLFFAGVSSNMMMMMMTGVHVDLCNKSALLRKRWTCIEREKRNKNNQIRPLITIILLTAYVHEITPCGQ
jgi:hypothetical protein